jgi:hypothetical protein
MGVESDSLVKNCATVRQMGLRSRTPLGTDTGLPKVNVGRVVLLTARGNHPG